MSCLRTDEIYAYLEGLPGAEAARVESHAASCPACRTAIEERRALQRAADTLDLIAVPDGFAVEVLARLGEVEDPALPRLTVRGWLAAALAGAGTFGAALLGLALLSGRDLGGVLVSLSEGLIRYLQGALAAGVKVIKYVWLFFQLSRRVAAAVLEILKRMTELLGPGVQIACLVAAAALMTAGVVLWRRRASILEDRYEP